MLAAYLIFTTHVSRRAGFVRPSPLRCIDLLVNEHGGPRDWQAGIGTDRELPLLRKQARTAAQKHDKRGPVVELVRVKPVSQESAEKSSIGGGDVGTPPVKQRHKRHLDTDEVASEISEKSEADQLSSQLKKKQRIENGVAVTVVQPSPPSTTQKTLTELVSPYHFLTRICREFLEKVPEKIRYAVDLRMGKKYDEIMQGKIQIRGEGNSVESMINSITAELTLTLPQQQPSVQQEAPPISTVTTFDISVESFTGLLEKLKFSDAFEKSKITSVIGDLACEQSKESQEIEQAIMDKFQQDPSLLEEFKGKSDKFIDFLRTTADKSSSGMML